jgi:hypothetical protein
LKRMRFLTVCGISVSAVFHIMVCALQAQAPASRPLPLILGTWKLNTDKSSLRLPANHVEIRQYRMRPDGFLVGLLITSDPQGSYHYLQFTAKSDGKDYPEYTEALLADMVAAGKQTPRTYGDGGRRIHHRLDGQGGWQGHLT